MSRELNERQEKYCFLRSRGVPVTEAYRTAGYAIENGGEKNAYKLESKTNIKARIQEHAMGRAHSSEDVSNVNEEYVIAGLVETAEKALQRRMIRTPGEPRESKMVYGKFDASGARQSLEAIGKAIGMFKEADKGGDLTEGMTSLEERVRKYAKEADEGEAREGPVLSVVNASD